MPDKDYWLMAFSEMRGEFGELKGRMDTLILLQTQTDSRVSGLEKRTNKLENSRAWVCGAAASISAAICFGFKFLGIN